MHNEPILILGPFPPPVHGFSVATKEIAKALASRGPTRQYDLASKVSNQTISKLHNCFITLGAMTAILRFRLLGGKGVSLGCNGGGGLIFTYFLLQICRLLGLRSTLHHHSYAYINDHVGLMARIVAASSPSSHVVHVFLAEQMQDDFVKRYGPVDGVVLPNAYMVPRAAKREPTDGPLVLGLLSNLSCDKGLDRFVTLAQNLKAAGIPFRARLAGPVVDKDAGFLEKALTEIPELDHAGPVYGKEKADWLASLDLFVFPTNYRNEAQPIVIYEAMAQGVPTLSVNRGCIAEQVGDCLEVMPDLKSFDREAADLVIRLAGLDQNRLIDAKDRALERLAEDTRKAWETIDKLFGDHTKKGIR